MESKLINGDSAESRVEKAINPANLIKHDFF